MGVIASMCDRSVSIRRCAVTQDAAGASVRGTPATLASGVAASIWPLTANVIASYARRDMLVSHTVAIDADPETVVTGGVSTDDLIYDEGKGITYVVVGVQPWENAKVLTGAYGQLTVMRRKVP